jgi:SNF2 family DNA or RNA helicase
MTLTYGTVRRDGRRWLIECEPMVRAHLKRVFGGADKSASKVAAISSTPENDRNLLWFLQRYPMQCAEIAALEQGADAHVQMERQLADLNALRVPIASAELAVPAREYQLFAAQMAQIRRGLLLADDVGLGKSISAICPMVRAENLPAVVICPAHMPRQWVSYLNRFAPHLLVHRIRSGQVYPLVRGEKQRISDLSSERLPDVIVLSYHMLRKWSETLAEITRYVVFDEVQQLRSGMKTEIYRAASYISRAAQLRMGLSATPIYNYGHEFWNVCDALIPGALGEYDEFIREWCTAEYGGHSKLQNTELFGDYLRREGIMLRRTRAQVGRELPPLQKIVHAINADVSELDKISGDAVALARVIVQGNESFRGEQMQAAGKFEALMRQATGVAKAPYVAEFVRILLENGHQVVLFGWHRAVYAIWQERLAGFNPAMYTGEESAPEKERAKQDFIDGRARVLIMSLRSGAGVDGLQHHCSTAVFGELDWSPGVHEQCVGRITRDGQTEPTIAYFLTSDEGCDPIMLDVLGVKREQIEGVRNPGQCLVERVDNGENQLRKLAQDFLSARGESVGPGSNVSRLPAPELQREVEA